MIFAKVTTKVTYKVPAWGRCNIQGNVFGQTSKDKCRFCVKEKDHYRCALYNEVLSAEGVLVNKARACQKSTAGFTSVVEDETTPKVDPKKLIKTAIAEYNKVRKQLIDQGYPEVIADKLATEYLTGGK